MKMYEKNLFDNFRLDGFILDEQIMFVKLCLRRRLLAITQLVNGTKHFVKKKNIFEIKALFPFEKIVIYCNLIIYIAIILHYILEIIISSFNMDRF
jgi:hypothetical protein